MKKSKLAIAITLAITFAFLSFPITIHADNTARNNHRPGNPNWVSMHLYEQWNWVQNWAYQAPRYSFETTYPVNQWSAFTTTNVAPQHPQNIRRDRHAAYLPPPAGVFSGVFDTPPTNPFMPNDNYASHAVRVNAPNMTLLPGESGINVRPDGTQSDGFLPNTSVTPGAAGPGQGGSSTPSTPPDSGTQGGSSPGFTVTHRPADPPPADPARRVTVVEPFADGTIGRIMIPTLNHVAHIRPGLDMAMLDNYVGHFPNTSQWDGNVALASHNRGRGSFFAGIWNLQHGDLIFYETTRGVRAYEVISIERISETDLSHLDHSHDNILTLITCVEGQRNMRWSVRAREVV